MLEEVHGIFYFMLDARTTWYDPQQFAVDAPTNCVAGSRIIVDD